MKIPAWVLVAFVLTVLGFLAASLPSPGDLAQGHLVRREYDHAREGFRRQLQDDPSDLRAWLGLAAVYEALGDPTRQIEALEMAARRLPSEREPLERLVDAREWTRDLPGTIRALERLTQRVDANDVIQLQRLLSLYALTEQWEKAVVALRRLFALQPGSPAILNEMLTVARAAGDVEPAIAFMEGQVARRPRDVAVQKRLAEVLDSVGEAQRARERWRLVASLAPTDLQALEALRSSSEVASHAEIERLEQRRRADPKDEAARQKLFNLYTALGGTARAMAVQRELVALHPNDPDRLLRLGELLVRDDRAGEAVPFYERALARAPDRLALALTLAQLHEWTGQPERSLATLDRASAAHPGDRALAERVVALAEATGRVDRVIAVLDRLAAQSPPDERYPRKAIDLLVASDRSPEAIPRLARLVERHPGATDDAQRLAQLYEWTNQPAPALAVLERVATARPADRALGERLVALAAGAGQTERAVASLDRLARQFPKDPKYPAEVVDLLVAADRTAEAVPYQRRIVELSGGAVPAQLRLAQLYEWTGREREALGVHEALDRAGRLPESSLARLGELYRFQDRPADFLRVADRLLAGKPDDEPLRLAAADTAAALDRRAEALRLLRPLVERLPRDEVLVLRYLTLAAQEGHLDEVQRIERRFLAGASDGGPEFRAKVARLLTDLGRQPEAITEWQAVLAARPTGTGAVEITARLALADLYEATGAADRALAEWEALARARPRDVNILRNLARRAQWSGKTEVARRAYRAILAMRPDDAEALKRTGQILAGTGDARGAIAALERFTRVKGGDYEVHSQLGELYAAARDEARARAEYERALRLLPRSAANR